MEAPRRRWRLGNPLSWRMADRCLAIAVLMIGATTIVLISAALGGWPFLSFPAADAPQLPAAQAMSVTSWALLAGASLWSRRRDGKGRGLALATTILFTITLAGFTLISGPFASTGWVAYLGGAVVGYVLFSRALAIGGAIAFAVLVIGAAAVLGQGTPAVLDGLVPPAAFAHLDGATVARHAVASLALFALTFTVIAFIVDRWRAREDSYLRLASTDVLTGLTNRRRFLEIATRELARARRYGSSLALVLVDLDHFKGVNDQYGHQVGDQVLTHAAQTLAAGLRDVDVIARHGGEEFAILLAETDLVGAAEVADRCCRRLAATPIEIDGAGSVRVTASMGVAAVSGVEGATLDALLGRADAALYAAKGGGRDRVVTADPTAAAS